MRSPFLRRQRTALLVVLALLLAQAIGLAHGIAHPGARNTAPPSRQRSTAAARTHPHRPTAPTTMARRNAGCSTSSRMPIC